MTKLTLELPDTAAAKLTDMSPKQLAELSLVLGYTVLSVTVHSSEVTRRRRANEELYHATTRDSGGYSYLVDVPWDTVDAILSRHGFNPIPEGALPLSLEQDGRIHVQVDKNNWLVVSWHRMEVSRRYEIVAYLS